MHYLMIFCLQKAKQPVHPALSCLNICYLLNCDVCALIKIQRIAFDNDGL